MRRLCIGAIAAAVLAATAGSSLAGTVTVSPAGNVEFIARNLNFQTEGGLINPETECDVTLSGTLERSFDSSSGSTEGTYTSGQAETCATGQVEIIGAMIPLKIHQWLGTYPHALTGVLLHVEGVRPRITVMGVTCSYGIRIGLLGRLTYWRGTRPWIYILSAKTTLPSSGAITEGSFLCPPRLIIEAGETFETSPEQTYSAEA
jgi:hypothetical protein